ncbi:MAG: GNAT family N-acetyltransferase [Candidatus Promineofilum sp.]|jgi:RimJ/RimL family protein N-acetyltransferase|nr:GNAT family N-acetyltransferase [Promineifilum sp.]
MDYTSYFWQGQLTRLRPLRADDAEAVYQARFDSPARQLLQLGVELPGDIEAMRDWVSERAGGRDTNGLILFAIENLAGEYVGGLSYHSRDRKNGNFSFGVVVVRAHQRRGYAQDATRLLLRYGFLERRYHKCNSACLASNTASAQLHRSLGFVEEGVQRQNVYYNGRYHDELLFGLTRDEFDANDAPFRPEWIG